MKFGKTTILLIALVVSLAACSKSPAGNEGTKSSVKPAVSGEAGKGATADGPLKKFDQPVEITTVRGTSSGDKYPAGDDLMNNIYTRGLLNELNIVVKYKWTVDSSQVGEKMNVMIATGDLPDFMRVSDIQYKQLAKAGMLMDLEELYAKYAAPATKNMIEADKGVTLDSARIDGKLYALPFPDSPINSAPLLWIRKDWLKTLNLPEPKSMDEVIAIARAFKTQDPDRNQKDDTYGLGVLPKDYRGFLNGYHAYHNIWLEDKAGNLVYGSIQPEMKTALGKLQELYKEGLIDPEFAAKGDGKVNEDLNAGKIGIYYTNFIAPFILQPGYEKLGYDWQAYPLVSADAEPAKSQTLSGGIPSYYVVSKKAKNPEAFMKIVNFFAAKTFPGSPDFDFNYVYSPEGIAVYNYTNVMMWPYTKNLETFRGVSAAIKTGDASKLKDEPLMNYKQVKEFLDGNKKQYGIGRIFAPDGSYAALATMWDQNRFNADKFYGVPTDTMTEKGASLKTLQDEAFTKIIMGAAPLSEFDKFVEDWKKLGGAKITEEVNAWYKAKKK